MADAPQPVAPNRNTPDDDESGGLSAFSLLSGLLRHRRVIVLATVIGLAGGLVVALLQVPRYTATVRFVSTSGSASAAGGVGSDMSPVQQRDPFDYYTSVLTSSDVLDTVLKTPRADGSLIADHLPSRGTAPDAGPPRRRLLSAQPRLDSSSRARTATSLPVLLIETSWTDPEMAADLANAFVDALAKYDSQIRSSSARQRRQFIEGQIEKTAETLENSEEALRTFKEQNRLLILAEQPPSPGASRVSVPPLLELRRDQLQREVTVQSDLYLSLKKAFDQARISELDDASGLVIIERASPPRGPIGTPRRSLVMMGAVVGLFVGLGLVGVLELRRRADLSSPEAQEFVGLVQEVQDDFVRLRDSAAKMVSPRDHLAAVPRAGATKDIDA